MNPQLKRLVCASFLAAVTSAGDAEAHGPGDFMYGGPNPHYYPPQHRMLPPRHETFLSEVFGPYGLLGQMGPLGPGAPLGGFFNPRSGMGFDPRFQQFPAIVPPANSNYGGEPLPQQKSGAATPPPGMCNMNNDSRYPNWVPCKGWGTGEQERQKGGWVTGPDGKTNYVFPLPPGH